MKDVVRPELADAPDVTRGLRRSSRPPRAVLWLAGLLLATVLMVGVSRPFVESIVPWAWEPAVDDFVPEAGHIHRYRQEGWTDTVFGRYGIPAIPNLQLVAGPAVLIWGDSQVEAFQVDDRDKMAQQVTVLAGGRTTGVGIGRGGREIADYLRLMDGYERLCAPQLHVIVVPDLRDAWPEVRSEGGRQTYHLTPHPTVIEQQGLRRVCATLGLDFAFSALRRFQRDGGLGGLRFRPGPVRSRALPEPTLASLDPAAAAFTAAALREATTVPILLFYVPTLPVLEPAGVDTRRDPDEVAAAAALAEACRQEGIAFVDLGDALVDAWRATGRLPRGFANGVPARGHLNEVGHRVVAEAIVAHLVTLEAEV